MCSNTNKTRRDLEIILNFWYLKSYEGAEIIVSTGVPDPLEKKNSKTNGNKQEY